MEFDLSKKLRIAFMGTPDFAVPVLSRLMSGGYNVVCIYTQPPKRVGRGKKIKKTPVHIKGDELNLTVKTPVNFSDPAEVRSFNNLKLDCAVVAAYGLILPQAILESPKYGCINVHASLLPRWRGAAPIQHSILAGDTETGITIMQMDQGLDTGQILMSDKVNIGPQTTGQSLHDILSIMGCDLTVKALSAIVKEEIVSIPQPESGITYANKLDRNDGRIDWTQPSIYIDRLIRAFTPWPGAWFELRGERIKILSAEIVKSDAPPGMVIDDKLTISCGNGGLKLIRVQRAGKSVMDTIEFLRGFSILEGTKLN